MCELAPEYAAILAFDVKIEKDAEELATDLGVRLFKADIIYHLFDQFTAYMRDLQEQKKREMAPMAIFPCVLHIVPGCVFTKRSPLVIGVEVTQGSVRIGTPICTINPSDKTPVYLGRVTSIELNHRPVEVVRPGQPAVAIKLEVSSYEPQKMLGRHFTEQSTLISKLTRTSIDCLKEGFRDQLSKEEWGLVAKLKKELGVI